MSALLFMLEHESYTEITQKTAWENELPFYNKSMGRHNFQFPHYNIWSRHSPASRWSF